jgi:3-oxoacyl-[acyl-carrier protein] reductase
VWKVNFRLDGRTALVTGGARGIGRAVALALASLGADVAVTDLDRMDEAESVANEIRAAGRRAVAIKADASNFADAERAVGEAHRAFGALDVLVNNAGITRDGVVWRLEEEAWDAVIAVDLKSCFNFTRAAAPIFKQQGRGRIVNVSSINGIRGKFGQSNYAAAKAGVIGFTKSVARELGRYAVTVNAVAPGYIDTEMTRVLPDAVREHAIGETVLGRLGAPDDVAAAVAFLASDAARHITGTVLVVDGGQNM